MYLVDGRGAAPVLSGQEAEQGESGHVFSFVLFLGGGGGVSLDTRVACLASFFFLLLLFKYDWVGGGGGGGGGGFLGVLSC